MSQLPHPADGDEKYADAVIRKVVQECPRRLMGTASERKAHDILADEFRKLGYEPEFHHFRWNRSLYVVFVLHFGLVTLGTALLWWSPALALVLHALPALSYYLDSTRKEYILRRLLPWRPSRNLLAVRPAEGNVKLRVVVLGHVDAAYTGIVFKPAMIKAGTAEPPIKALRFTRKAMLLAVGGAFLAATLDAVALLVGFQWWFLLLACILTVPAALTFLFNLDVVLRNTIVPGANDNLTGCVGAIILADRLKNLASEHVELVFGATGGEEAGTGGSWALARDKYEEWSPDNTLVIAIDGLSNGELRMLLDGEFTTLKPPAWLDRIMRSVAEGKPGYEQYEAFEIPTGATDVMPFLARGYEGTCIGCIDPEIGAPREYHRPSDTPDNLDLAQIALSVDFIEDVIRAVVAEKA